MIRLSLPLVRQLSSRVPARRSSRNVWDLVKPSSEMQNLVREMDRRMNSFENDFFKFSPFSYLSPRLIPVEGAPDQNLKFQVNVDVSGFEPGDIKLTMSKGSLRIEAKQDTTNEDGSRLQQHIVRELTLPDDLDATTLDSQLYPNGTLCIQAMRKGGETKKIPIAKEEVPTIEKK